jgi:hypothetical protein
MVECNADKTKSCNDCVLNKHYPYCEKVSFELALDLINRQEAEIVVSQRRIATLEKLAEYRKKAVFERVERNLELRKDLKNANVENESLKAEVERLKAKVNHYNYLYKVFVDRPIADIKAEAYNKFAYLLKKIPRTYVFKNEIDNLLNELVGGNNE